MRLSYSHLPFIPIMEINNSRISRPNIPQVEATNSAETSSRPRAPSRDAKAGALAGLFRLPELTRAAASHLDSRSRLALSQVNKATHMALGLEVRTDKIRDEVLDEVMGFQEGTDVTALLKRIGQIRPESLQSGPLEALGAKIQLVRSVDQAKALDAFLSVARNHPEPRPALFDSIEQAYAYNYDDFDFGDDDDIDIDDDVASDVANKAPDESGAKKALRDGATPQQAATDHHITNPETLAKLHAEVVLEGYSGGPTVGEKVLQAARNAIGSKGLTRSQIAVEHGITNRNDIRTLREYGRVTPATLETARSAVMMGDAPKYVAGRFNITHKWDFNVLLDVEKKRIASGDRLSPAAFDNATYSIGKGKTLSEVSDRWLIIHNDDRAELAAMEKALAPFTSDGSRVDIGVRFRAEDAVKGGATPQEVAERFGITHRLDYYFLLKEQEEYQRRRQDHAPSV